jgi:hypothetical protein
MSGHFKGTNTVPLTFIPKGTTQSYFEVRAGAFAIGTVGAVALSGAGGPQRQYRWQLTVSAAPPGFQRDGRAYSLEDAKAGIEGAWQTWISAAGLTELPALEAHDASLGEDRTGPGLEF